MSVTFRKPGNYSNKRHYPQGGKKRRIGRGVRQLQKLSGEVARLKDFVNVEFKFYDKDQQFVNIPYITAAAVGTPLLMQLNSIPPGDGASNRNGAEVRIKSMQHSCTIDNTATGSLPCRVRMVFFLFLRPDQRAPTLNDVLDVTSIDPINSFRNLQYRSSYVILKDTVFKLDTTAPQHQQYMDFYKKLNFHTQWVTTAGGAAIAKNALYCMVYCDQAGAVMPRIRCSTRVRYVDN